MTIGDRIKKARNKRRLTQKELLNGDISLEQYNEWKTNWPATSGVYNNSPKQWRKDK